MVEGLSISQIGEALGVSQIPLLEKRMDGPPKTAVAISRSKVAKPKIVVPEMPRNYHSA